MDSTRNIWKWLGGGEYGKDDPFIIPSSPASTITSQSSHRSRQRRRNNGNLRRQRHDGRPRPSAAHMDAPPPGSGAASRIDITPPGTLSTHVDAPPPGSGAAAYIDISPPGTPTTHLDLPQYESTRQMTFDFDCLRNTPESIFNTSFDFDDLFRDLASPINHSPVEELAHSSARALEETLGQVTTEPSDPIRVTIISTLDERKGDFLKIVKFSECEECEEYEECEKKFLEPNTEIAELPDLTPELEMPRVVYDDWSLNSRTGELKPPSHEMPPQ